MEESRDYLASCIQMVLCGELEEDLGVMVGLLLRCVGEEV